MSMIKELGERTIADFGEQWTCFKEQKGYLGSVELLDDIIHPLLSTRDIQGKRVAEIGSGTGRVVRMLLDAGAEHVTAIEPSEAYNVLKQNMEGEKSDKVRLIQTTGDHLDSDSEYDLIFSLGVLHHVPEPAGVVRAAYKALRPGGKFCIWLYAKEGNEMYLSVIEPLRRITVMLPHSLLMVIVRLFDLATVIYGKLCNFFPLPLRKYFTEQFNRFDRDARISTIYDQLNPTYAKYYDHDEVIELMSHGRFNDIKVNHRHGYSWTAVGVK